MARNVSLPNSGSGAAARARFEKFVQDRNALSPDDQPMVLSIIARNADAAAFEQLHAIAKSAKSETELRRDLLAMMDVADPQLAARAARIALSDEIPPQAASLRLQLVWALKTTRIRRCRGRPSATMSPRWCNRTDRTVRSCSPSTAHRCIGTHCHSISSRRESSCRCRTTCYRC
jgi:hypothetical protein